MNSEVTTHLIYPNRTEFDGITAITESNADATKGESKADGTTTKQGYQTETETGGAKSTMKPIELQFMIALLSTIIPNLTSIFAM